VNWAIKLQTIEKLHDDAVAKEAHLRAQKESIVEIRSLHAALLLLLDELQLFLLETENELKATEPMLEEADRYVKQYVLEDGLALLGIADISDS
jgi:hypothetical protein